MKPMIRIGMFILVGLLPVGGGLASSFKSAELHHKSEEIASLRGIVGEKVERAAAMRQALADQMAALAEEIRYEKDRWRIESFRDSVGFPRIAYDLKLLQQLQAYVGRLDERIAYFREAGEVLDFYFQQINDDLMMIRTLDDFTVDHLIDRINGALDEYVPASQKKIVALENLKLKDPEIIWQEIFRQ